MSDIIAFLTSNWDLLVGALFALLTLASIVTKFTDTPKDDEFVRKLISWLSFLQPKDAPGVVKAPLTKPAEPDDAYFRERQDL